jgi:hypothetical protein
VALYTVLQPGKVQLSIDIINWSSDAFEKFVDFVSFVVQIVDGRGSIA